MHTLASVKRYLRQVLSTPSGAEQESDADRERERGVGPRLERLIDGVDHVVADFAHGLDRLLAFGAHVRHHAFDVRARTAPGRAAPGREDVGKLVAEPRDVAAQRLEIGLDIAAGGGGRLAALARRILGVLDRVANGLPERA